MNGPATEPLVRVENLSVDFAVSGERVEAVKRASFEIGRGEILGLVGEAVRDAFDPRKTFA